MSREDVFIANVLKSRPPGNRDPQPLEIEACRPYLFEQVHLIEPRVVCTLGNFATKLLSGSPAGITKVRGTPQVHELGGRTVFLLPLFHPAAALRTPAVKETLREDFSRCRTCSRLRFRARPSRSLRSTRPSPRRRPSPLPTSSTCSVDAGYERLGGRDRGSGAQLAEQLKPGDVVVVSGEVGAGKTTFIRGACRALGVEEPVTSPTFTIGHRYRGRLQYPTSTSIASGASRTRIPACWTIPRRRGVTFIEWPAAAEPHLLGARRSRCGSVTPTASAGRSRSFPHPVAPLGVFDRAVWHGPARTSSEGESAPDEGTEDADCHAGGRLGAVGSRAGLGERRRVSHYVACGVSQNAKPSSLPAGAKKGAFSA